MVFKFQGIVIQVSTRLFPLKLQQRREGDWLTDREMEDVMGTKTTTDEKVKVKKNDRFGEMKQFK